MRVTTGGGLNTRRGGPSESPQSFDEFFHRHYEQVCRVMFLSVGDQDEAQDVVQEAFVRVLERWDRLNVSNAAGYVYRTALNQLASRRRRLAREPRQDARDYPAPTEDRVLIEAALESLTLKERMAVVLVELLEFTPTEAGEMLGIAASTVRVRVHRAHERARAELGGDS